MDIVQIKVITLFAAAFLNGVFTLLIWLKVKSKEAFYLGWLAFFSALYGFSWWAVFFFKINKLFWARATWSGALIISANIIFIYCLTGRVKFFKLKIIIWHGLAAAIFLASALTPYVIPAVSAEYPYIVSASAGPLNQIARLFPIAGLFLGLYYLFKSYKASRGYKKLQLKYFISGLIIYLSGGLIFGGVLPLLSPKFFAYLDAPVYFSVIWLGLASYAIIKKKLFDIKIILTELLVSLIALILFVQIFLMQGAQAKVLEFIIFALFCFIAYLLTKATYREIAKEQEAERLASLLSDLNKNLEKKVKEKTGQLQESLDKIEAEKNKTLAIINNFIDPIIVLDKENRISLINPAAAKVFGLGAADLGEKVPAENKFSMSNFHGVIKKDFQIKAIAGSADGDDFSAEELMLGAAGQEMTYKAITARVAGEKNEALGAMKIFYNLTREKMIDKVKSEFITVAAHQLRTPLAAAKWALKLVVDGDAGQVSGEQKELLNKSYQSTERVIRLVNDLLNVSRIEEGKFDFDFKPGDFREAVSEAAENVKGLAARYGQELTIIMPDKLPPVKFDKEKIIMVLQNLLDNAIKYTPKNGKVELAVKVVKNNLSVSVKDHGVGIPLSDQPKLFSKFFRAANVVKLETEGSGLGLYMAKNIVENHGGKIGVTSREGEGTEISFSLPIA